MADPLKLRHPFFRSPWRRGATVLALGGWTLVEILQANGFWAVLAGALTAYCVYEFYVAFDHKNYEERND